MYKVLSLNNISPEGLKLLPSDQYTVGEKFESPDAIILRSYKMHGESWPASVKAIARAGAGVNNMPTIPSKALWFSIRLVPMPMR